MTQQIRHFRTHRKSIIICLFGLLILACIPLISATTQVFWTYNNILNITSTYVDINKFSDDKIAVAYTDSGAIGRYFVCDNQGINCTSSVSFSGTDHVSGSAGRGMDLLPMQDGRMFIVFRDFTDLNYPHGSICYENGTCGVMEGLAEASGGAFGVHGAPLADGNFVAAWDYSSYNGQDVAVYNASGPVCTYGWEPYPCQLYPGESYGVPACSAGTIGQNSSIPKTVSAVHVINGNDIIVACDAYTLNHYLYSNLCHWNGTAIEECEEKEGFRDLLQLDNEKIILLTPDGLQECDNNLNNCEIVDSSINSQWTGGGWVNYSFLKELSSGIVVALNSDNLTFIDPLNYGNNIYIPVNSGSSNRDLIDLNNGNIAVLYDTGGLGIAMGTISECVNDTECSTCQKCSTGTCINQSSSEDLKDECSANFDSCLNTYTRQGPNGFCDGTGICDTNSGLANVSAGHVCDSGTNINASSSINCGIWADCITGQTSAEEYYVGYTGIGTNTCDDTDWQSIGTTWNATAGYQISITEHTQNCSTETIPIQHTTGGGGAWPETTIAPAPTPTTFSLAGFLQSINLNHLWNDFLAWIKTWWHG